jgi:molybdopterin synthase sulfur carrier subunit
MEWKLFADLAELAGDRTVAVTVDPGDTVGDALDALLADRPALRDRVLEDGELADHINLLRNGQNVLHQDGLATELEAGDELALFPPVSGGSPPRRWGPRR